MRFMMNNFFKQTCFLRTELLPQEIPLFFFQTIQLLIILTTF